MGCQSHIKAVSKIDKAVFSQMIDLAAVPIPPSPSSKDIYDTIVPQQMVDSLKGVKLVVAVHPIVRAIESKKAYRKIPKEYMDFVQFKEQPETYLHNLKDIHSKNGHTLILADTVTLKEPDGYSDFDILLGFSRPVYNKDSTKAVLEMGISRGSLFGSASIVCLKKEENKWQVDKVIDYLIW